MAALESGQMSYVLDEATSAVAMNEFLELPNMFSKLYSVKPSSGYRERRASTSGLGKFQAKTPLENPAEDVPTQQFQKDFDHTAFALTVPIEREFAEDQRWGIVEDIGIKLGDSANRTMEFLAAALFIDSFSGATYRAEDGLSICNSAHLNAAGGNSQDNSGTTAISTTSIGTTRNAMRDFTDYRGERILLNPDLLIVPIELEQTAWEAVRNSIKPGGNNNELNFFGGMFDVVVWNYLTDATDWWMADSRLMQRHLHWYMRTGLEVYGDGDLFAGKRRIGGYFRQSHGCTDWRWVYGHQVA